MREALEILLTSVSQNPVLAGLATLFGLFAGLEFLFRYSVITYRFLSLMSYIGSSFSRKILHKSLQVDLRIVRATRRHLQLGYRFKENFPNRFFLVMAVLSIAYFFKSLVNEDESIYIVFEVVAIIATGFFYAYARYKFWLWREAERNPAGTRNFLLGVIRRVRVK